LTESVEISHGPWRAGIERRGAQLRSLKMDGAELLWPGDPDGWKDSAPILFPVVGRLWPDALRHQGRSVPHPMHGMVRAAAFDLVSLEPHRVVLRLDHDGNGIFPWAFGLEIEFSLDAQGLSFQARVLNPSPEESLPFQFGWHPGFSGSQFRIGWETPQELVLHEVVPGEGWRTGERREVGSSLTEIAWTEQPTAWVTSLSASRLRLDGGILPLSLAIDPPPEAWVFWQRPGQSFLCLEPWYGLPDQRGETCEFIERTGTRVLEPGETWQMTLHIGKA
jgi:galactose mutarotase-like enzyme